jgi:hypothetical protein
MFTPNELNYRQAQQDRAEAIRRAERARLVREALSGKRGRVHLHKPLLALIGEKMVDWGMALQGGQPAEGYSDDPLAYQPK